MTSKDISALWVKYGGRTGRFLATFLDNARVFKRGKMPRRGPLVVVFNAGGECDAKCSFCDWWKEPHRGGGELSTEERKRIIRDLGASGVWLLSFCIAEPLLMGDLEDLILEARKSGMLVNISTNGSRLEEKAGMISDSGVRIVTVSIDSHDAGIHDGMRGYPGLFGKVEKGISRLKRARKGRRPWIIARHLVNGKTYFDIDKFIERWENEVDEIVMKPMRTTPDGLYHVPEDMRVKPGDGTRFREYFSGVLRRFPGVDNAYHRRIPDYLFGTPVDGDHCFAGTFFADVGRSGEIYPCVERGEVLGSLTDKSFMDIWKSQNMAGFRRDFREKRKCRDCWGDRFMQGLMVQGVLKLTGGMD